MGTLNDFSQFIRTPEGQGLLSAAFTGLATAQRGAPLNSIGRAGMGGLLGYSNAMNAQDTRAEQEMQRKMRQMQMDEMVRKQGEEQRIRDLAKGSMLSPEQQAIGQFGPTNEGATAIGQFKPKFDTESFVSGLQGINPIEGIKLRQSMAKESPFDKVNPKDFTPASIAKFAQSKNYADLEMQVDPFKMNKADELKQRHLDRLAELQAAGQIAASNRQPNQPMAPIAYVDPATGQTIWGTITEAKGKPAANYNPTVIGDVARGKARGTEMGHADSTLSAVESSIPQIESTIKDLKSLGDKATYTMAGQARDAAVRQLGMGETEGAVAREKYTQTVRDVLFPQLRATFGAQFTVKEGEALVATLGDPNKGPEAKNAALDAFISQKKEQIKSLERQTGKSGGFGESGQPSKIKNDAEYNALPSGAEFIDPFGKRRRKP